jgi:hypothetical protein
VNLYRKETASTFYHHQQHQQKDSSTSTTFFFHSANRIVSHASSSRASMVGNTLSKARARPTFRATHTGAASATRAVTVTYFRDGRKIGNE